MDFQIDPHKARLIHAPTWVRAQVKKLLQNPKSRTLLTTVVVMLSFTFMGYLIYHNWQELTLYRQHLKVRYPLIFLAFLLYPAGLIPNALGWHNIIRRLGDQHDFKINARIYCYSCLPRHIPGGVWHIAGRVYLNKEQGIPHASTLLGTLLEWTLLVASGLLVYTLSNLALFPMDKTVSQMRLGITLGLLVPTLIFLHPKIFNRISSFFMKKSHCPPCLPFNTRDLLALLAIYLTAWTAGGLVLYVLSQALFPLPLIMLPAVIGAWGGSGALGFIAAYFLHGLGIRDVTLALLLGNFMPLPISATISILFRLLLTVGEAVWPLLWARLLR